MSKRLVGLLLLASAFGLSAQTKQVYLHSDDPAVVWKLKPQAEVKADADALCTPGYNTSAWVDAVVPGTAFGDCGEGFLRISYAYSLDDLKLALGRVRKFVERLEQK